MGRAWCERDAKIFEGDLGRSRVLINSSLGGVNDEPQARTGPNLRSINFGKMPPSRLRNTVHAGRIAIEKAANRANRCVQRVRRKPMTA